MQLMATGAGEPGSSWDTELRARKEDQSEADLLGSRC